MANLIITIFGGFFGLHKFVQGKTKLGIIYFFTMGLFGIGWFIDIFIAIVDLLPGNNGKAPAHIDKSEWLYVPGCQSITRIRNMKKDTLMELQKLSIDNAPKKLLQTKLILTSCDSLLSQHMRIINDCTELINSTTNLETFFSRYDTLIGEYQYLVSYEPFVQIKGCNEPSDFLNRYQSSNTRYQTKFIDRCYNQALIKADSMKTEQGKHNQFVKMYDTLQSASYKMTNEAQRYLNQKFQSKLDDVEIVNI